MNLLLYIILFNLIGSFISLLGGVLLLLNEKIAHRLSHHFASFAAGSLLGTVFFDLFPEAIRESEEVGNGMSTVFVYTLGGILFFFLLERFLHWFHHHNYNEHKISGKPVIPLLIIGDTIHNFIDGIAIAATFLISIPAGIITTFAVGIHEIPQEIGDFGIMLKKGLNRKKILAINILSAFASFAGAIIAYYYILGIEGLSVAFISIAAGFFLYVALSDLIPEIHHENKKNLALWETLSLFLGVFVVYFGLYLINNIFGVGH